MKTDTHSLWFKVSGYTFRRDNSVIFILASLLNGVNFKGKEFATLGANSLF